MVDSYVDLTGAGSATSPYDTWAKAAPDIQTGLTAAGAGGRCFVKTDSTGTNKDTAVGNRMLTSSGSVTNPTLLIGVKSGTTNTGDAIINADCTARGAADAPEFETTSGYIYLQGTCYAHGVNLDADARIRFDANHSNWIIEGAVVQANYLTGGSASNASIEFRDSELEIRSTSSFCQGGRGSIFLFHDCLFTFTATPNPFLNSSNAHITFIGCDLSGMGTGTFASRQDNQSILIQNSKVPATFTPTSGGTLSGGMEVIFAGCTNDDALGAGDSVPQYYRADSYGETVEETTMVRSGGANDDTEGAYSYKVTAYANQAFEPRLATFTPWLQKWVKGDGRNLEITVYIANDGAGDLNEDEAFMQLMAPNADGSAQHSFLEQPDEHNRGSTTPIADDTGSTWGGTVGNHQKLTKTYAPAYEGWLYVRVGVCKKQSTPDSVYVDPRIEVKPA